MRYFRGEHSMWAYCVDCRRCLTISAIRTRPGPWKDEYDANPTFGEWVLLPKAEDMPTDPKKLHCAMRLAPLHTHCNHTFHTLFGDEHACT